MKRIVLIAVIAIFGLTSCQFNATYTTSNDGEIVNNLIYFKDPKTGLCFASINSYNGYGDVSSITCVPCDSLRKLGIK